jgi:hypothetical protein
MQIEVTTKALVGAGEVVIRINFVPRGSGNRGHARRVGRLFREDPTCRKHLRKLVVGLSSVILHLDASFDAWTALGELVERERQSQADRRQWKLFGQLA